MRDVRELLGLEELLHVDRAGHAHLRQVVATQVDEHHVLGPVLLGGEKSLGVAVAAPSLSSPRSG